MFAGDHKGDSSKFPVEKKFEEPIKRGCFTCGKMGHISKYCPVKSVNYVGNSNKYPVRNNIVNVQKCLNCNEADHKSNQCPYKKPSKQHGKDSAELVGLSLSENVENCNSLPLA